MSISKPQHLGGWHTPIFWFCGCRDRSERVTYADNCDALAADLADSRLIAREQEDAHVAANMRNTHLQERIVQLEAFLNRCYEGSRAPYAEEMDNEHIPMPESK